MCLEPTAALWAISQASLKKKKNLRSKVFCKVKPRTGSWKKKKKALCTSNSRDFCELEYKVMWTWVAGLWTWRYQLYWPISWSHLQKWTFLGWALNTAFACGCLRTDGNHIQPGSGAGLNAAKIPLCIICCLKHRAVVWKYSRKWYLWNDNSIWFKAASDM